MPVPSSSNSTKPSDKLPVKNGSRGKFPSASPKVPVGGKSNASAASPSGGKRWSKGAPSAGTKPPAQGGTPAQGDPGSQAKGPGGATSASRHKAAKSPSATKNPSQTKQPSTKQPPAKQPSTKQPSAKQPSAKQPSAKQPSTKPPPRTKPPLNTKQPPQTKPAPGSKTTKPPSHTALPTQPKPSTIPKPPIQTKPPNQSNPANQTKPPAHTKPPAEAKPPSQGKPSGTPPIRPKVQLFHVAGNNTFWRGVVPQHQRLCLVSHLPIPVSHLPIPVSHLPIPVSHLPIPVSHLPIPVSHLPIPVSHLPIPVSHLPIPVSHLPIPVSHLPLLVSPNPSPSPPLLARAAGGTSTSTTVPHLPIPVSHLPLPISRFSSPPSHLPLLISPFQSPASHLPLLNPSHVRAGGGASTSTTTCSHSTAHSPCFLLMPHFSRPIPRSHSHSHLLTSCSNLPSPHSPFSFMPRQMAGYRMSFTGILSGNAADNPFFHNWNMAVIMYCDGGAYMGYKGRMQQGSKRVFLSGHHILKNTLIDLQQQRGMGAAASALIAGCSAGGQAVAVGCDWMASFLPRSAKVKCATDASFFLGTANLWTCWHEVSSRHLFSFKASPSIFPSVTFSPSPSVITRQPLIRHLPLIHPPVQMRPTSRGSSPSDPTCSA
ncbi:unnamed protein product [Closterium sp. Naga37s-1]|nr:unnamed protein product [Closterium sp. Naga37s-1]